MPHTTTAMALLSPIVELRQYTLRPGQRDVLIELFDREFVEPQEAAGIRVIGEFRNLDDPNKFVWLRGFRDMPSRAASLTTFYEGPVWRSHRDAANATIIDNDNVLLLRPVTPALGATIDPVERSAPGSNSSGDGIVVATIYHLDPTEAKQADFVKFFSEIVSPVLASTGGPVIAAFVPSRSANTFPRLPVREGEHVFVWLARFASQKEYEQHAAVLAAHPDWRDSIEVDLSSRVREPQTLRLSPTARSRLRG